MSTPADKIAGAPISWRVCEVPGWGYLTARDYDGWYVLEQDAILTDAPRGEGPVTDVRRSADYLRQLLA